MTRASDPGAGEILFVLLVLALVVGTLGYYWYLAWLRPPMLFDLGRRISDETPPCWPLRSISRRWMQTRSWLWFIRAITSITLLIILGLGVAALVGIAHQR